MHEIQLEDRGSPRLAKYDDEESLDSVSPNPHDQFKGDYNSQADELSHRVGANESDFKAAVNFENDDNSIRHEIGLNPNMNAFHNPT
jgi:hypothetical protein